MCHQVETMHGAFFWSRLQCIILVSLCSLDKNNLQARRQDFSSEWRGPNFFAGAPIILMSNHDKQFVHLLQEKYSKGTWQ